MKVQTTMVLAAATLILFIVIGTMENVNRSGRSSSRLLQFEPSSVTAIVLRRGGQEVIMKREGPLWFFLEPERDLIASASLASVLDQLNRLTILDQLEPSEQKGEMAPENLGLSGEEALEIELQMVGKERKKNLSIKIGRETPRAGSVYASREGDRRISVVEGNPQLLLASPFASLRERRLVTIPPSQITTFSIQSGNGEVTLERQIGDDRRYTPWKIVRPIQAEADQEAIEELMMAVSSLQINEVDRSAANSEPSPESEVYRIRFGVLGLDKPVDLMIETLESEDDFAPPTTRAQISDRPLNYFVNSGLSEVIPRDPDDLRDRKLAKIPEKALESIVLLEKIDNTRLEPRVLLKAERNQRGVSWKVNFQDRALEADYLKISELIERMNEPVIVDFVDKGQLADHGMAPDSLGVGFNFVLPGPVEDDGSEGQPERFARTLQFGWKEEGDAPRLFANWVGESEIFELDPAFASLLPMHPLKWRSLNVLSINEVQVSEINQFVRGRENIKLTYDKIRNNWDGTRNGVDISANIDPVAAGAFARQLCSLRAQGWLLQAGDALRRLQTPESVFEVTADVFDQATSDVKPTPSTVKFVPSSVEGIIFGQIEGNPDVFYIREADYRKLIRPVTSSLRREIN